MRGLATMGRKKMRVSWTTIYGAPPPRREEGDDVLNGEEEYPKATGIISTTQQSPQTLTLLSQAGLPAKKTRRTATVVEVELWKVFLDWVVVWRVRWKELLTDTKLITEYPNFSTLMNRSIIHD